MRTRIAKSVAAAGITLLMITVVSAGCKRSKRAEKPRRLKSGRGQLESRARQLNSEGCYFRDLCEFDSAMTLYRKALALAEEHHLTHRRLASLQGIATVFTERSYPDPECNYYPDSGFDRGVDAESAAWYLNSAIGICIDSSFAGRIPSLLVDLGLVYLRLPEEQTRSESLLSDASAMANRNSNFRDEGWARYHLGLLYGNMEKYRKALAQFDSAVVLFHRAGDRSGEASAGEYAQALHEYFADRGGEAPSLGPSKRVQIERKEEDAAEE